MFAKQPGGPGGVGEAVPAEEAQPIYEAAVQALHAGRTVFTCGVPVGFTVGGGMNLGGRVTQLNTWDAAPLIEAIEGLGWRLQSSNHVWAQTEQTDARAGIARTRGLTVAHMLFRRAG
ncbi:hypothetical protein [Krasilnikovia sp. MM14-A1004]|uniref:hypothetical protein n=1 Tax=Krasilnikovia sp. MM14-A1004 TaxID=3373541 RepID=UPI00399CB40D